MKGGGLTHELDNAPHLGNSTSEIITAALLNAHVRDNLAYLYDSWPGDYKISAKSADHGPWLICDFGEISRTTYASLFAEIGTFFGVGDNSSTFNKPDPQGRALVMKGSHADVNALGDNDGVALANRTPKHNSNVVQPTISAPAINVGQPTISAPAINVVQPTITKPNVTVSYAAGGTNVALTGAPGSGGFGLGAGDYVQAGAVTAALASTPTASGGSAALAGAPVASGGSAALAGAPVATGGTVGPGGTRPIDMPAYEVIGNLFIHI